MNSKTELHIAGLHGRDAQMLRSAMRKSNKPEEGFSYAATASKRAERQRLVKFIRSAKLDVYMFEGSCIGQQLVCKLFYPEISGHAGAWCCEFAGTCSWCH